MPSAAVQVENVISKAKDYDVTFDGTALEYSSWMLPGKSEASSYNLITNLRNIEESAGDGTFNTLTISVPCSIASYKDWLDKYDTAGVLKIASIEEPELSISFNVRVNTIGDFNGALDSINAIDIGFKVLSLVEE
jgi:hypothetical protein